MEATRFQSILIEVPAHMSRTASITDHEFLFLISSMNRSNPFAVQTRPFQALAVAVVLACAPAIAGAWGAEGHRLVAELAATRLSPAARSEAERLLALEPGATLISIGTWADEVRTPVTAPWHFVNFPPDAGCRYDGERMCPHGACVTGAIERQAAILRSKVPDEQRLHALKYLVHQPLHAGYADDKGGNAYQIRAFGRGTNLHALWDSGLITQWQGGLNALRASVIASTHSTPKAGSTPAAWTEESCRVMTTTGFYPDGHSLPSGYQAVWSTTLVQQLAAAGVRLGGLLESALLAGAPK